MEPWTEEGGPEHERDDQAEGRAGADEGCPQRSDERETSRDDQAGGAQDPGAAEAETGADEAGGD